MRVLLVMDAPDDAGLEDSGVDDYFESITAHFEEDELLGGLRDAGHEVLRLRGLRRLLEDVAGWRARCDLVLNCSDGVLGPESAGWAASILDACGIPYVGSPGLSLGLQRDKHLTKVVARAAGVHTPDSVVIATRDDEIPSAMHFPVIVKPIGMGSSIGVVQEGSVHDGAVSARARALALVERYQQPALVETFVRGLEVEVPVLLDPEIRALDVAAISVGGSLVQDDRHLTSALVQELDFEYVPPPGWLDRQAVQHSAVAVARALGVRDYGRVDFRIDRGGGVWLIEANGHPSLQRHSSFTWSANRRDISYAHMLDAIIRTCAWRTRLLPAPTRRPWTDL